MRPSSALMQPLTAAGLLTQNCLQVLQQGTDHHRLAVRDRKVPTSTALLCRGSSSSSHAFAAGHGHASYRPSC